MLTFRVVNKTDDTLDLLVKLRSVTVRSRKPTITASI